MDTAKEPQPGHGRWTLVRRDFLAGSGLLLAGMLNGGCTSRAETDNENPAVLSFGMMTDSHYADADPRGNRHYRESISKMNECVQCMNDLSVDFLIELGDFKDQAEPASEMQTLEDLRTIEAVFARFKGPRYHVLGNHDMDCISKNRFLVGIENTGIDKQASFYSFDCKGFHCIVLDANYTSDGADYDRGRFTWSDANIPPRQLAWLESDLQVNHKPVIAFVHQQLNQNGGYTVRNAGQVRHLLEQDGKTLAVFHGHYHEGQHQHINGIHYYTLKAMVDGSGETNNAYATVEVQRDGSIVVSGYRKAESLAMNPAD